MKLWYRYLFFRLIQSFFFLLFSILVLYVIIDFSIRGVKIVSHDTTTVLSIVFNYLHQFAIYFDLFASIAFLLASLKVFIDCNTHREFIALQMAGLSRSKLLLPFFILALFLALASIANNQWFSPDAGSETAAFAATISPKKTKKQKVFSLALQDDSELIYQNFLADTHELSDVYWVRSAQDVWHMKRLKVDSQPPTAYFTDHLIRNKQGQFEKLESFALRLFPEMPWEKEATPQKFVSLENRSLTTLFQQAHILSSERNAIISHLYYKLALALFPLLILLQIAPRAFSFSRNPSSFLFVACALFALLGFITLLNGMLILAENRVMPALLAIWGPIGLSCIFALRRVRYSKSAYKKMKVPESQLTNEEMIQ